MALMLKRFVVARVGFTTVASLLSLAGVAGLSRDASGQVMFQTGFENFAPGAALGAGGTDGFVRSGAGTAVVTNTAAFVKSGLQGLQLLPQSAGNDTLLYYPTPLTNTLNTSVTATIDLAIKNASPGTASRAAYTGLAMYDLSGNQIASFQLTWDRYGDIYGGDPNTYYTQYSWHTSPSDTAFHGLNPPYTQYSVSAGTLNTIGFSNLAITVDYRQKLISFGLNGVAEETIGSFTSFDGFGYAALFYGLVPTGSVTPRIAADNLTVSKVVTGIPGDYNNDGFVDAADYTVWADNFGRTGNPVAGDGNADNIVDAADYTIWADNFGRGTPPDALTSAVPEPTGVAAVAIGGLTLLRRRR